MISISTRPFLGSVFTATAERAGKAPRELLLIDGVHSSEVAHISEEARGLDDLIDGEASFSEDRVDVAEDLLGLSGDAFGELARSGIDTELTRCEEHISDADSLTVKAIAAGALVVA